jgi:hypothetical protein
MHIGFGPHGIRAPCSKVRLEGQRYAVPFCRDARVVLCVVAAGRLRLERHQLLERDSGGLETRIGVMFQRCQNTTPCV